MKLKILILLVAVAGLSIVRAQTKSSPSIPPFALVELFTSEGDHASPPADELLRKIKSDAIKNNKPVYTVAYHVDYWNKYGWKDPYSKLQFTYIQRNYMSTLNQKEMFTPQMIVNGRYSFTGSDEAKIKSAIDKALKTNAYCTISIKKDSVVNDTLYVSYQSSVASSDYSIKVLLLESGLKSAITAGDNKGKTLLHENVCRVYQSKSLNAKSGQLKIPVNGIRINVNMSLLAFVQMKGALNVLGICTGKL